MLFKKCFENCHCCRLSSTFLIFFHRKEKSFLWTVNFMSLWQMLFCLITRNQLFLVYCKVAVEFDTFLCLMNQNIWSSSFSSIFLFYLKNTWMHTLMHPVLNCWFEFSQSFIWIIPDQKVCYSVCGRLVCLPLSAYLTTLTAKAAVNTFWKWVKTEDKG